MGKPKTIETVNQWIYRSFPPRQIFLRSEGRVRFLTIGTGLQIVLLLALVSALGWGIVATHSHFTQATLIRSHQETVAGMAGEYDELAEGYQTLEGDLEARTRNLEARQRFLEDIVRESVPTASDALKAATDPGSSRAEDPSAEAASDPSEQTRTISFLETLFGDGDALPLDVVEPSDAEIEDGLKVIEQRQSRLAAYMIEHKKQDLARIDTAMSQTGVNALDLASAWSPDTNAAKGGPFEPTGDFTAVFAADDADVFQDLRQIWETVELATMSLESVPVGKPAEKYYISSPFGPRIDPLRKVRANHPGLDLAGWPGTHILATAPGTVIHASWNGPYGNMIEIDHGNGFHTRYGHMRRLRVTVGETVNTGDHIGDMGKTGRVTDTHLHYEIWFKGEYIDPAPFLKAQNDVQQIRASYEETSHASD